MILRCCFKIRIRKFRVWLSSSLVKSIERILSICSILYLKLWRDLVKIMCLETRLLIKRHLLCLWRMCCLWWRKINIRKVLLWSYVRDWRIRWIFWRSKIQLIVCRKLTWMKKDSENYYNVLVTIRRLYKHPKFYHILKIWLQK